jgi:iron complex transport system permease protein
MPATAERTGRLIVAAGALSVAVMVAAVLVGVRSIAWLDILRGAHTGIDSDIVWRIRLPRVCLGFVSGAVLAVGGLALQAVFRNPLATPYTLGVSSGASVGAALYMKAGYSVAVLGISGLSIAAWLSATAATALVFGLTRAGRGFSTATLLLTGVALSFFFSSVVLFIQYIGDVATSFRVGRWLMGGLEVVGFGPLTELLPFAGLGLLTLLVTRRELDLLAMGDESAANRGVDVTRVKVRVLAAVSMMVGAVVAICGPIGFVGLIVPHVGRLVIGPRHDRLVPLSLLGGGSFLVLCDVAARTVVAPVEVPVGVITALLGGPFFLALLMRQHTSAERERGIA